MLGVMFKHYVICHGILSYVSTLHLFRGRESMLCLRHISCTVFQALEKMGAVSAPACLLVQE